MGEVPSDGDRTDQELRADAFTGIDAASSPLHDSDLNHRGLPEN